MNYSLNQIYYGPPGTGKTYYVTKLAEEIVNINVPISSNSLLDNSKKFDRILKLIRESYQSEDFKAKSNSLYRNDRAIMWILGYLKEAKDKGSTVLSKSEAIQSGMDNGSSSWSQISQYVTHFGLVDNWRDTTNIRLNTQGLKLLDSVSTSFSVNELKTWNKDKCPQIIIDFYSEILASIKLEEFTPVLKMIYGALCMASNGQLYKQNNESRAPTDAEKILASRYFDIRENIKDLKWIGHLGRMMQGLGLVKLQTNQIDSKIFYTLTLEGETLINNIIGNWEQKYPNIFTPSLSFDTANLLGFVNFITFHQSYSYEEFIEGLKPVLADSGEIVYEVIDGIFKSICSKAISTPEQKYVLIIDEINRGNISKIFGELITLIEPSKRLFQSPKENPQSALLPYSRTKFSVPNNVFILGTMNSADKSITNIDTALRRRFDFIEIPPVPSLLQSFKHGETLINMSLILSVMNDRIEYLLDRDHLIGHSYFIKVNNWDELCKVFHHNILPTLLEYFFNDWKKVAMILGDSSNVNKTEKEKFLTQKSSTFASLFFDDDDDNDNVRYEINPLLQAGNYQEFPVEAVLKSFNINV